MEENNIINDDNKSEAHLTSAAAFVEGGIQFSDSTFYN